LEGRKREGRKKKENAINTNTFQVTNQIKNGKLGKQKVRYKRRTIGKHRC